MADSKLVEYIKASRLSGRTDREIKKTLTDIGWTTTPVDEALSEADSQSHPTAPVQQPVSSQRTIDYSQNTDGGSGSGRGRVVLLLVTVGLLLIFALVGAFIALRQIPSPGSAQPNASQRDQDRQSDIKSYAQALSKYFDAHGRYPAASGQGMDSTNGSSTGVFDNSGVLKTFQSNFAQDPKNGESLCHPNASIKEVPCAYKYRVSSDGKKFILWAVMENSYNNEGVYTVDSTGHKTLVGTEPTSP